MGGTPDVLVSQAFAEAIYNFPTPYVFASFAGMEASIQVTVDIWVSHASVEAVIRQSQDWYNARSWVFKLDGHIFYVLQLADETLIFDVTTQSWQVWGNNDDDIWRAQIGQNWNANVARIADRIESSTNAEDLSNVICGDNTTGTLYFLHPQRAVDDFMDGDGTTTFERIVYGQVPVLGRDYVSCDGVELQGSVGNALVSGTLTVKLEYSDDRGDTFVDAGTISSTAGDRTTWFDWRSLGSMRAPGRLFRITDYGGLVRLDGLYRKTPNV